MVVPNRSCNGYERMRLSNLHYIFKLTGAVASPYEDLRELEPELREAPTIDPIPTTDPGTDDDDSDDDDDTDDDKDDDDDDDRRGPGLIHNLRGSCGIISAVGTHLFSAFPSGPIYGKRCYDHFVYKNAIFVWFVVV